MENSTDAAGRECSSKSSESNSTGAGNRATLAFLLACACRELFPEKTLFIEHSMSDGYYCHFGKGVRATERDVRLIAQTMIRYLESEVNIELSKISGDEMSERFSHEGREDKLAVLDSWRQDPVPSIRFGGFVDYRFEPMTEEKSPLLSFELEPYDAGFVLRLTPVEETGALKPFVDAPKLYQIIKEHERWGRILGVSNIGELNRLSRTGEIGEMIRVAEGLHEKKISQIADGLCEDYPAKRVVLIAGPSASGKTTFAKRLGIQLKVTGLSTLPVSMDNYFLDRDEMPVDEQGRREYESITVLDVDALCDHILRLLNSEPIPERIFDFSTGRGYETGRTIEIPEETFIILEGIHGLNPLFAERVGKEKLQRIYVSALTQLNVDNEHRVSTADNRLLRRLVRDNSFRGYSSGETLSQWSRVRKGEEQNIFPYQEEAEFMFNSSLIYEIPVLANLATSLLEGIPEGSDYFQEAQRLVTFLSFFTRIAPERIPETSILREFIGGSGFDG
ncbi:MAG: nucleoside kinase [Candidatus Neomarinimicrobiota bacterium]